MPLNQILLVDSCVRSGSSVQRELEALESSIDLQSKPRRVAMYSMVAPRNMAQVTMPLSQKPVPVFTSIRIKTPLSIKRQTPVH